MASETSSPAPLPGDPARQAVHALRGFAYQIWRTVEQWLSLEHGETLFVECAEDIDLAGPHGATAIQVKETSARLSLASKDARDAIIHSWELKKRVSGTVRFQFLTRAAIATEQGTLLERRPGIEIWREAAKGNLQSCALLRSYLIESFSDNLSFRSYLQTTPVEQLLVELVQPFEWVTEEPNAEIVQEFIRRRLVAHGERRGSSPSISARALDPLFRHCWEVAQRREPCARSLTVEDFLFLFDQAVSVPVPMQSILSALTPSLPMTTAITLTGPQVLWTDGIPPLPDPVLTRDTSVTTALESLSRQFTLVLTGSAGKGKTTLAKLIALAANQDCHWMDCSGRDASVTEYALSALAIAVSNRRSSCVVVIDDIPIDPGSDQRLWTSLAVLQHACRRSGSKILVTTRGVPKAHLDSRLHSSNAAVQQVEDLAPAEVSQFLERLGCPSSVLPAWSKLTFSHTYGHPKLVHVFALDLRSRNWPAPRHEDILSTPESITGQRAHERLRLSLRETGPSLEFLYHLTLVIHPFDRLFALDLGRRIDGLPDPGTVLDRLLGVWIEPSYSRRFRVTSLLTNEAVSAWSPQQVREAHQRIYESYLAGRKINIANVFEVLMHGISAQQPGCLLPFLRALLDTKPLHLPHMTNELRPVIYLGSGVGNRAVSFDSCASLLLRLLQFRIATREDPQELPRIADEWSWEVEALRGDDSPGKQEFYYASRALWASSIALSQESTLSPKKVLDAIMALEDCRCLGIPYTTPAALVRETESDDMVAHLFSFFEVRCRDIEYLDRLLDALVTVPDGIRSRMLDAARFPHVRAFGFLVDTAWVGELRKEVPDWENVVRVLRKTLAAAREFASPHLGLHAAKALSIVSDEYLANRQAALAVLDEGRMLFGDDPILTAQLANLHFHHGEFSDALKLWEQSLSNLHEGHSRGIRDPFAFRNAAIAAGKIGDFGRAAELFLSGSRLATAAGLTHTAAALLYDSAYCLYKAKRFPDMCKAMRDGLPYLQGNPDPDRDPQGFALQKFAGHIVLWVLDDVARKPNPSLAEPSLGCSSNPSFDRSIGQLPPSCWELTAIHLAELEHRFGLPTETVATFGSLLRVCQIPSAELRLGFLDIEKIFREARFIDLLPPLEAVSSALARVRAQHRQGIDVQNVFQGQVEDQDRVDILPTYYLLCALTLHILSGGDGDALVESWIQSLEKLPSLKSGEPIRALLDAIALAAAGTEDALRNTSLDNFTRLAAAHLILTSSPTIPALSALAQIAFVAWLSASHVKDALRQSIPVLSASFARTWQFHLQQPALLSCPKLTVPALNMALSFPTEGPERLRRVLAAASGATGVHLPSTVLEWLHNIDRPSTSQTG